MPALKKAIPLLRAHLQVLGIELPGVHIHGQAGTGRFSLHWEGREVARGDSSGGAWEILASIEQWATSLGSTFTGNWQRWLDGGTPEDPFLAWEQEDEDLLRWIDGRANLTLALCSSLPPEAPPTPAQHGPLPRPVRQGHLLCSPGDDDWAWSVILRRFQGPERVLLQRHRAALVGNKPVTLADLFASVEWLQRHGLIGSAGLGLCGASHGAMVAAAAMLKQPHLFGAVVCQHGPYDMLTYHRAGHMANLVCEYGHPDDPGERAVLLSYSPYHLVKSEKAYPPLLLTSSRNDKRVPCYHSRKFAARLIHSGHPVHYYESQWGGHFSDDASFLVDDFLFRSLRGGGPVSGPD